MNKQIKEGSYWRYKTRPGEEKSLAFVTVVDAGGVHYMLVGIRLVIPDPKNSGRAVTCPVFAHAYLTHSAFAVSVTEEVDATTPEGQKAFSECLAEGRVNALQAAQLTWDGLAMWNRYGRPPASQRTVTQELEWVERRANEKQEWKDKKEGVFAMNLGGLEN